MLSQISTPLDPGIAALLGALLGAGASVVVQIIAAAVTARHETRAFRRTLRKETIASVADAYEYALNVIFGMQRGAAPDHATRGNVFAQVALRGSPRVKEIVTMFLELPPSERQELELKDLIVAMQQHLAALARDTEHPPSA